MNVRLEYEETQYLPIASISVIGEFNNFDPTKGKMIREEGQWIFECSLLPGEYRYKFLINNEIKLNDPLANLYDPDEQEELWSVLMINEKGQRLYNNTEYSVNIENYNISSNIYEEIKSTNKKEFNVLLDKKVAVFFQFTKVTGLHSITALWYTPQGEVFEISENNLFTPEGEEENPINMWFWIDLDESISTEDYGMWVVKLFIDGQYILEDAFSLGTATTYLAGGQYSIASN